ncbi:ABC-F family ATP-binding cassette domain-containing protein [Vaginisenegalia massiliensis]|uniref:ABC-F family ATP-binding cassette domain-containing protein n=1 Tax=Vaginisenegalia massiliensis TaxID=2058294 RepID=UPI000F540ABB|nr:ABC-F family ATP-binding cassette domain-containing protein [Vaginisenegalia massiliensis]
MKELIVSQLTKTYGTKTLLDQLNFSILEGRHIGLIGPNGTGKSSFLKVLAGVESYDEGEITKPNQYSIAYLAQNPDLDNDKTVLETVYDSQAPLIQLILAYEKAQVALEADPSNEQLLNRFMKLSDEMNFKQAWDVEVKAKMILSQLGIHDLTKQVGQCSGGQRKRIGLAQVLIAEPDLLILDEPTNHLDVTSIQWLENFLAQFKGAFLLVTHDRYFLERSVNKIVELRYGKFNEYEGNYETYLVKRAEQAQIEAKNQEKQDRLFQQELAWMRKGAKARTTKQQARIDRFDDLKNDIASRHKAEEGIELNFDQQRIGNRILEFEGVTVQIGQQTVIHDFTKTLVKGDRIGIIGPNGIGKTTLLNAITGGHPVQEGNIFLGQTVRLAYYRQLEEDLPADQIVLNYLKKIADNFKRPDGSVASAAQMLEQFNFPRNTHGMLIGQLSGGEKRRLYLLTLLIQEPNVLILDEPTNDLDIDTLTVLEDYLDHFNGVVLIVSHDRYFLDKTATQLLVLKGKGEYDLVWDQYSEYLAKNSDQDNPNDNLEKPSPLNLENNVLSQENKGPKSKKMTYAEKKEWETIESDIAFIEERIEEIQADMMRNANDSVKLMDLQAELEKQEMDLLGKYERYDYLCQYI